MNHEQLASLVEEVASFFCSDKLLVPTVEYDTKLFALRDEWKSLTIRVRTKQDYLDDIYIRNQNSYCVALNDWFSEIETWAATLRQFDMAASYEAIEGCFAEIDASIENSTRVNALVTDLLAIGDHRYSRDDILDNFVGGIVSAAQHIIDARVVFLGTRFGLTEAVFAAYKDGLFPFGYDRVEMELLCIRP